MKKQSASGFLAYSAYCRATGAAPAWDALSEAERAGWEAAGTWGGPPGGPGSIVFFPIKSRALDLGDPLHFVLAMHRRDGEQLSAADCLIASAIAETL